MIVPSFLQRGASALSTAWRRRGMLLGKDLSFEVEKNAQLLKQKIQARASGRPGPNVITGVYRASWHVTRQGEHTRIVSTDEPQAARLELGFVGVDAIGRHYAQPPFPHVGPAVAEVEGAFLRDLDAMVTRGL